MSLEKSEVYHIRHFATASRTLRKALGEQVGLQTVLILLETAAEPWVTMPDLGQRLGLTKASVSRNVSYLEERGLMRKEQDVYEARRYAVALTDAGYDLVKKVIQYAFRETGEGTTGGQQ